MLRAARYEVARDSGAATPAATIRSFGRPPAVPSRIQAIPKLNCRCARLRSWVNLSMRLGELSGQADEFPVNVCDRRQSAEPSCGEPQRSSRHFSKNGLGACGGNFSGDVAKSQNAGNGNWPRLFGRLPNAGSAQSVLLLRRPAVVLGSPRIVELA